MPVSYNIEAGFMYPEATLTVGQEIPDSWFESRTDGNKNKSEFGISAKGPSLIEQYLTDILSTEFAKLSEDERKQYDFLAISRAIKDDATKIGWVPDVVAIMQAHKR